MPRTSTETAPPRTVLVTGASSGIGRATAIEFARQGRVRLLLVARRHDALAETARLATGPGVEHELLTCDLADAADVTRLVADVAARTEHLDVLVNNAGAGSAEPLELPDGIAAADHVLALNLGAPIALAGSLFPLLAARGGCVVNVSSVAGLVGTPGSPVYSATKWGLTGFSEALRARWAPHGVRVCCVQPGPVPTPGFPHERLAASRLRRRVLAAEPDAIARTIVRCASGRAGVSVVRPRTYAPIPLVRGLAPWLVRRLLASGRVSRATAASSRVPEGMPRP